MQAKQGAGVLNPGGFVGTTGMIGIGAIAQPDQMQSDTTVAQSTLRRPGGTKQIRTSNTSIDRHVAYPVAKQKARAVSSAAWSGYGEWKETRGLEVCTKTGAVVSVTLHPRK